MKSKPRGTSKVWEYFGLLVDENRKETNVDLPVCRLCFVQVSARWGNTSNLFAHLRKNHPEEYLQVKPTPKLTSKSSSSGQQTIENCLGNVQPISTSSQEHRKITAAVTRFLAKDMVPLYQVDKSGFRDMMKAANL